MLTCKRSWALGEESKRDWWGMFNLWVWLASAVPLELSWCQGFMCYKYERVFDVKVVWQWQTATCPDTAKRGLFEGPIKAKMLTNRAGNRLYRWLLNRTKSVKLLCLHPKLMADSNFYFRLKMPMVVLTIIIKYTPKSPKVFWSCTMVMHITDIFCRRLLWCTVKKCWVFLTQNLGQIWTNPNVELKCN